MPIQTSSTTSVVVRIPDGLRVALGNVPRRNLTGSTVQGPTTRVDTLTFISSTDRGEFERLLIDFLSQAAEELGLVLRSA